MDDHGEMKFMENLMIYVIIAAVVIIAAGTAAGYFFFINSQSLPSGSEGAAGTLSGASGTGNSGSMLGIFESNNPNVGTPPSPV